MKRNLSISLITSLLTALPAAALAYYPDLETAGRPFILQMHTWMILLFWLFMTGIIFITGSFTSRILIDFTASGYRLSKIQYYGSPLPTSVFFIALLTFLANAVHLVLHASIITETPLEEVHSVLIPFLVKIKYGRLYLVRTLLLAAVIPLAYLSSRGPKIRIKAAGTIFSVMLLITFSMSGHQGTAGYLKLPFILDIIHILAASVWIGGVFYILARYIHLMRTVGVEACDRFITLIRSFSALATICVVAIVTTGILMTLPRIHGLTVFLGTSYGRTLLVKVALVTFIMLLGGYNKYFVVPWCNVDEKGRLHVFRRRLYILLTAEALTGLGILLATSLLTHLSPEG